MKRIILTGGGTAGHVTPNIALLPRLRELGYDEINEKNDENSDVIKAWTVGEEVIGDLKIMDIADQTKADPYEEPIENVEEKVED